MKKIRRNKEHNGNYARVIWFFIFLIVLFMLSFVFFKSKKHAEKKIDKKPAVKVIEKNKDQPPEKKASAEKRKTAPVPGRTPAKKDKIVIVIDDFGYNLPVAGEFIRTEVPVTFSILPDTPYSAKVADIAHKAGRCVILHLPLESAVKEGRKAIPGTITTDMTKDQIQKRFAEALRSVPYASGVNNHEGSKATENYYLMKAILEDCKRKGLFYLDSRTSYYSAVPRVGRNLGMRIHVRDVFLDNEDNPDYILIQLEGMLPIAENQGYAVGIGHARKNTALAVKKFYDENKATVEFIYLDELYK
ncbi:MAG: divergent polysaccharide deacetylase family protein [Armatimonadota bacterium]